MQLDRKNMIMTRWLQKEFADGGCTSVLDLGCGQSSLLQYIPEITRSTGVECWAPYVEESLSLNIHSEYILSDIMDFSAMDGSYDAVMLVDVLEHLEKDEGLTLLARMSRWATRKVIVMVPNGYIGQDDTYGDGNTRQRHLSGWTPREFEQLGYHVRGFHGWKPLRGEAGNIIPTKTKAGHYLLAGISRVSEPVVQVFPSLAYHLFAVLNLRTS